MMMIHAKSESDSTSIAPSSPRSPKRPMYYVQSPSSRDSHDADNKSSSIQPTATYNSPMESPSRSSLFGPHSRISSSSRVSGAANGSSWGRKVNWKRNEKLWNECNVVEEERDDEDLYGDREFTRSCQILIAVVGLLLIFTLFCLIIWGASRPYKTRVSMKNLIVHNFYMGQGSDLTGVPTKLLTVNCSVKMIVDNPATFFGIHVSSTPFNLFYSQIIAATGQSKKYYQPRKSRRVLYVNLEGDKIPLYGAGASLAALNDNGGVPMKLEFEIRSQGDLVGKLVKTKHRRHISCFVAIDSATTKAIQFKENSCTYK